jgi:hypothetical protein
MLSVLLKSIPIFLPSKIKWRLVPVAHMDEPPLRENSIEIDPVLLEEVL